TRFWCAGVGVFDGRAVVHAGLVMALLMLGACSPKPPPHVGAETPTNDASGTHLLLSREHARAALCELYARIDTDCDKRLTVLDQRQCSRPPCPMSVDVTLGETHLTLTALHQVSQLATELAEALNEQATANEFIRLQRQRVFQGPVEYLADRI